MEQAAEACGAAGRAAVTGGMEVSMGGCGAGMEVCKGAAWAAVAVGNGIGRVADGKVRRPAGSRAALGATLLFTPPLEGVGSRGQSNSFSASGSVSAKSRTVVTMVTFSSALVGGFSAVGTGVAAMSVVGIFKMTLVKVFCQNPWPRERRDALGSLARSSVTRPAYYSL